MDKRDALNIAVIYTNADQSRYDLDLMRLRRKIDSRIDPHPFREQDFNITNPIINEIVKYGEDINIDVT
jgi:hypothetical protein